MIRASLVAPVSTLGLSGFCRRRTIRDARSAGDKVGSDRRTDFNTSRVEGNIELSVWQLRRLANRKVLTLRQTYFVDNVTTSGHTLEAARLALGFGAGLVFADAATRRTQIQATLF